jgi:defect-in-organelle-trafficking protein DotB
MTLISVGGQHFDITLLDNVLRIALSNNASDIIIESNDYIYFDILGETHPISERKLKAHEVQGIVKSLYQENGLAPLTRGRYLQFSYSILHDNDEQTRFRVTVTGVMDESDKNGVEIIFRPFPELAPTPEQLGLPDKFIKACHSSFGLILVCGPTGSGKSTTLASILSQAAQTYRERIISFEDPIEFDLRRVPNRLAKVSQSEVPIHLDSFETATENALRRTPKKILIGETRTANQAERLAIAALTGHLVMTTLHTNSAELALPRLVDLFPQHSQHSAATRLIDAIRGIFHQKLVRNLDGSGRTAIWSYVTFNEKQRRQLLIKFGQGESLTTLMINAVSDYGQPLINDLREKFSQGRVGITPFIGLISEIGVKDDFKLIKQTAQSLLKKNKLSIQQHQEWQEIIQDEINT